MKKRLFMFMMMAAFFVSCSQPTIIDPTPQSETTTTTSSPTTPRKVDKDPVVTSWYWGGDVEILKYTKDVYGRDIVDINEVTYIKSYKSVVLKPGKYFIRSVSQRGHVGNYYGNGDFCFDKVFLKVNKKYSIDDRGCIEETNQ